MPEAAMIGAVGNLMTSGINQANALYLTKEDRLENFKYNEKAAINADKRTRRLYRDFYSPEALLRQYNEAGLSPSLMFGGTPGQGGMQGAHGAGTAGPQTPFMPISLVDAAQAAALWAQTEKTKAETKNINQDTQIKEFETTLKQFEANIANWQNVQTETEWNILNSTWTKSDGTPTSLFEMADDCFSYEEFLKQIRYIEETGQVDEAIFKETKTELGQQILRRIYENASRFNRDIMVLSEETVDASFQISIINALNEKGYAEKNAEAVITQLQSSIDTEKLNSTQKQAWQNMINRLSKKGSTWQDVLVVLGMIISNFAGKVGVQVRTGGK